MPELFLTTAEAAAILRLKDRRTVLSYARQGRIRIVGRGRGIRIVAASIEEYARGESEWHAKQSAAGPILAPSVSSQGASGHGKPRSRSDRESTDTIPLLKGQTLQRTSIA